MFGEDTGRVEVECRRVDVDQCDTGTDVPGQFALAMNDSGDVATMSPEPSPAAAVAPCSAAVPLEYERRGGLRSPRSRSVRSAQQSVPA